MLKYLNIVIIYNTHKSYVGIIVILILIVTYKNKKLKLNN